MKHACGLLLMAVLSVLPLQAQRHMVRRDGRVLAHSLRFNPESINDDMPEGLQEILRAYRVQPRYAERTKGRAMEPLLKSIRHQEAPFNLSCPYYIDKGVKVSDEPCLVGCVATCIEQVLNYYQHPKALADTLHGWGTENYRINDIMPGTPIDWDNILNDYHQGYTDQQAKAVADLSYYCGVAVHMKWGVNSSSASLYRAVEPLWRAFDYKTVVFLSRAMYSSPKWNAMLRRELENGRPICYTGHNLTLSGHAFNIDGVDEEGYYHLNWGYDGQYDGYFDLDYLNPFESLDDLTDLGQQEGFFSNQTAMFLHPDDIAIDITDSLTAKDAFAGVVVDGISFRRQPDKSDYVVADFSMTNTTQDSLNFTFEVLTYLPTDTAIFMQADYVALSTVNLAPGEHKTWPVYCHFTETGNRIMAFSADDETLPYKMKVNIVESEPAVLSFGPIEYQLYKNGDNLVGEFTLDIANNASSGYAGNIITYCLFDDEDSPDLRHWEILDLPAGESQRSTVSFHRLRDGHTYTLRVRCPWTVQQEYTFTVHADEATVGIRPVDMGEARDGNDSSLLNPQSSILNPQSLIPFDLSGRPTTRAKGLIIRNGKKMLIP